MRNEVGKGWVILSNESREGFVGSDIVCVVDKEVSYIIHSVH